MSKMLWITVLGPVFLNASPESEKQLDAKIEELKHEKEIQELQGGNEEIDGSRYMIGDWSKYAKEMEEVKVHQKKSRELQQKIKELEEKKESHPH